MKGRMFCASQASTAICSSMDHVDHKQTTTFDDERTSGRAIDRHNPIIKDPRRSFADDFIKLPPSGAENGEISNKKLEIYKGRRSFTGRRSTGGGGGGGGGAAALLKLITSDISLARKSFSCVARPACDFINTPVGSTRFLLGSDPESKSGGSAGQDLAKTVEAVVAPAGEDKTLTEEKKTTCDTGGSDQQVVVLKVSLHCRGCEGKVRKHLARMQGVTSFNIDFAAKKVTVTGDITPLEILDSISKVKNAQFWTTPTIPKPNVNIQNP